MIGAYCLLVIAFVWIYLPAHKLGTGFLVVLLTLVWLNKQFYLFLAGHRGKMFALAAIPFHILYFISSGLAFALAMVRYRLGLSKHRPSIGTPAANARAAGR
jgi:hypothetical protein